MATSKKIAHKKRGAKRTTDAPPDSRPRRAAGRSSPPESKGDEFAAGLVADLRARGIKDDGVAYLLTMEADRLLHAARQIVPPAAPQNAPLSATKSALALEVLRLAEQSFESGEETPDAAGEQASILREALRCAKDDLRLILAASEHLSSTDFTYDGLRAQARIDLALAIYKFKTAEEPGGEVSRTADAVGREADRVCKQAERSRKQIVDAAIAERVAS
jgi:hypothetical protein